MTREEAQAIVDALVTLREAATNEMALNVPVLYPAWKPGMDYKAGRLDSRCGSVALCKGADS